MNRILIGAAAVIVSVAAYVLMGWSWKPAPLKAEQPAPTEIVYICRETGEISRGPRKETPAVNPATGRATLVQALYCPQCDRWYPAPPAQLSERMPLGPTCPTHGARLLEELPAGAAGAGNGGAP